MSCTTHFITDVLILDKGQEGEVNGWRAEGPWGPRMDRLGLGACGRKGGSHSGSLLQNVAERTWGGAGGASVWNLLPEEEVGEPGNRFRRRSPQERWPWWAEWEKCSNLGHCDCFPAPPPHHPNQGTLLFGGHRFHVSKPFSKGSTHS